MQVNVDSRTVTNLADLMQLIEKLIIASWGSDAVTFVSAYPQTTFSKDMVTPIITYKVKSKVPGRFKSASERKPRLRDRIIIKNTNLPIDGETLDIWGQMFDYFVEFEVWGKDGKEADDIANRFQSFINKYKSVLVEAGANRFLFEELTSNDDQDRWRTDLRCRSIVYHIRIDEVVSASIPSIENISLETFLHDSTFIMDLEIYMRELDEQNDEQSS